MQVITQYRSEHRFVLKPFFLLALLLSSQSTLFASHAHLTYPDWWKPVREIALKSPILHDAEKRLERFSKRNSHEDVEKLAKEFFDMIDMNNAIMRSSGGKDIIVLDKWGRVDSRPDSDVHQSNKPQHTGIRDFINDGKYTEALERYKLMFMDRLCDTPKGFRLEPRHPHQRKFKIFVHQPEEMINNIITLFMYEKPQDDETLNGIVIKLDIGEPGAINWTYTPEGFGSAEETFPDDERFAPTVFGMDYFFDELLVAYVSTGDKRYLEKYAQYLDDRAINYWSDIRSQLVDIQPGRSGTFMFQHMAWACRNVPGFRDDFPATTLARVLMQFWKYNAATEMKIVRGIVPNRQITMYLNEAYAAAMSFPEFKASGYVHREMARVIESMFSGAVMPDGSNIEHALCYNPAVLYAWKYRREFLDAGVLRRHITPLWSLELKDNLTNTSRYILQNKLLNGWDWYPMHPMSRNKEQLLSVFRPALNDPLIHRMLPISQGYGPENGYPNVTSMAWPYMGIYILRTGWDRHHDQEAYMAAPRPYSTHTWKNNLDLQLFAFGQPLLTAHTESYGYVRGPGQTNWEKSFRAGQYKKYDDPYRRGMHQWDFTPVFVDGCPQLGHAGFQSMPDEYQDRSSPMYGRLHTRAYDTPLPNRWHESETFNIMEGTYDGPFAEFIPNPEAGLGFRGKPGEVKRFIDDVTHQRQVLLLKRQGLWIIVDRLKSQSDHTYNLDWKFAQQWWNKDPQKDLVPGFDRSEIAFDAAQNAFKTHDPDHANISLYMNGAHPISPLYHPKTNHYGATFAGKGEHMVITAAFPRADNHIELKSYKRISQNGNAGFQCQMPDGTNIICVAANAIPNLIKAGPISGIGELIAYIQEPDGTQRCFVLEMSELKANDIPLELDTQDAEFVLENNLPIRIQPVLKPLERVQIQPLADVYTEQLNITLSHPNTDVDIRYTLDGTDPTLHSPLYDTPLSVNYPMVLVKARAFRKALTEIPESASATLASPTHHAVYRKVRLKEAIVTSLRPGIQVQTALGDGYLTTFTPMNLSDTKTNIAQNLFEDVVPNQHHDFMIDYTGFLVVPMDGIYTLHAPLELIDNSLDSGYDLRLWLGDGKQKEEWYPATRLQNLGGWSVALKEGAHPFRVLYVDQRGGNLEKSGREWNGMHPDLKISGPGISTQHIPSSWLMY